MTIVNESECVAVVCVCAGRLGTLALAGCLLNAEGRKATSSHSLSTSNTQRAQE